MDNRFLKFLAVGGINTCLGFSVYTLLALTNLSTLMVLLLANIASIGFNFFSIGNYVFADNSFSRLPHFIISYTSIFIISFKSIEWLSPIYGRILAMAIILLPLAFLSYLIQTYLVFGLGKNSYSED
jgi:putative flippase GtrA